MTGTNLLANPHKAAGGIAQGLEDIPFPSVDAKASMALARQFLPYAPTPLMNASELAEQLSIKQLWLKDECGRMGLGSFKALGAQYVIAHEASQSGASDLSTALDGRTYVTASAGNHGMSVAAGAQLFGAKAVIYLAETVPNAFADRLRDKGAQVRIEGADYEASMKAAADAAETEGMTLLSDSSWQGYTQLPHRLMEGYLAMALEVSDEMPEAPTHIFLQAGVGGMAGAVAAWFRNTWADEPIIVVVEPDAAPALLASVSEGKAVFANGPVSNMGRLDCKEPSLIALKGLARDADFFMTITDDQASDTVKRLAERGITSTPSGVAGLAGLMDATHRQALGIDETSVALCIISEGAEEA